MRRIVAMLTVVLSFFFAESANAQQISTTVFTNVQYLTNDSVDVGWTRVLPTIKSGSLTFAFEFEFAQVDNNIRMEWMSQARGIYKIDDATSVYVGRNFKSFGTSLMAPVAIKTAKYPAYYPFKGLYGYGVRLDRKQVVSNIGTWNITADVSARPEGFREFRGNKPDFSMAVSQAAGNKSYGIAAEFASAYRRMGAFGTVTGDDCISLTAAVFAASDAPKTYSALIYMNAGRFSIFEPHLQYYTAPSGESRTTFGIAAITNLAGFEIKTIADRVGDDILFRTQAKIQM